MPTKIVDPPSAEQSQRLCSATQWRGVGSYSLYIACNPCTAIVRHCHVPRTFTWLWLKNACPARAKRCAAPFHIQTLLYTDAFTRKTNCTQKLVRTTHFLQATNFYTGRFCFPFLITHLSGFVGAFAGLQPVFGFCSGHFGAQMLLKGDAKQWWRTPLIYLYVSNIFHFKEC